MDDTSTRVPVVPVADASPAVKLSTTSEAQLTGWRFTTVVAALFTGLFLAMLDTTIVAVALTTIASQFEDFSRATWVVSAYLLTYMACAIIMARLSDIFGKKTMEVASLVIFLVFSMACAVSKSMLQLIVFRALQGVGGSGLYSMTMVVATTFSSQTRMGMFAALVSMVQVVAGVLGPILGGAISHDRTSSTWRWIFWLNLPIGCAALVALLLAWPRDTMQEETRSSKTLSSVDFVGAILLLAFSILIVFALQEGGTYTYRWNSPAIVVTLVLSGVTLIAFIAWQELVSRRSAWPVKGIFPIQIAKTRTMGSNILVTLVIGFTFYIAVVNLPQRFQIVSGDGATIAGVKLLPMMAASAMGSFSVGFVTRERDLTSQFLVLGTAVQLLGYGLMSSVSKGHGTLAAMYGYQVFLGLGFGISIAGATIMVSRRFKTKPQYIAATQGALTQMRSLGGSIGLAIAVIIFNSRIRSSVPLQQALLPEQTAALFKSPLAIESFSPTQQALIAGTYAEAFAQQMRVATYVSGVGFLLSLCTFEQNPFRAARSPAIEADTRRPKTSRTEEANVDKEAIMGSGEDGKGFSRVAAGPVEEKV